MKNRGRVIGALPLGNRGTHQPHEYADVREFLGRGSDVWSEGPVIARTALDERIMSRSVKYTCPGGHDFTLRLFAGAHVPQMWECVVHRQLAGLADQAAVEGAGAVIAELVEVQAKHTPKTHWEHVLARRTTHELEAVFEERLAVLRAGRRGERKAKLAA